MFVKPNEHFYTNENDIENDLYRKFKFIFSEILHPDDSTYDSSTYCVSNNGIEQKVYDVFDNYSDCVVPILGYTGMGKTFLMHYCIRQKFNINNLIKNKSFVVGSNERKSVLIYASYDAYKNDNNSKGRLAGKLASASNIILDEVKIDNSTKKGKEIIAQSVAEYIKENKPELLEEYAPTLYSLDIEKAENLFKTNQLAYEQEKLKWILTNKATTIQDVIIVLDDIEGAVNNSRLDYDLIDTYLKLYDCLRRCESNRNFKVKLFLCMRERTFNEIKKKSWYNTHRVNYSPFYLSSGIKLNEIFKKRFLSLEEKNNILADVKNRETWDEAKQVLIDLSNELEYILGIKILEICNYNVSESVQLFASILANRQWTQKNEKAQASFKIEKYQFYLSQASCFRAIAMRNAVVFTNKYHLPNIFFNNDSIGYCLPIHILLILNKDKYGAIELSLNQIQSLIDSYMKYDSNIKQKMMSQIKDTVQYFVEREVLFEDVTIVGESEIESKYFISPKGKTIIAAFFENTILLEIFRDDIYLDNAVCSTKCSNKLSREEVFLDILNLINLIGNEEINILKSVKDKKTLDVFYSLFKSDYM